MSPEKKKNFSLKALLQIIVMGGGAYTIFEPVFSKNTYYNAFIEGYGITNTQFATLFSIFTIVQTITFLPGGIIADKFSAKKLFIVSFLATAVLAVWESTFPPYALAKWIYVGVGITTTLIFWSAHIKMTRQFGRNFGGESIALGSLEGFRNVVKVGIATICVAAFNHFTYVVAGLAAVLRIYAVCLVIFAVLTYFLFDDEIPEDAKAKESPFKLALECLKNPKVWIVTLMVFGSYSLSANISGYITKIATAKFAIATQAAAVIVLISTYAQPIGSFAGGWVGNKLGPTRAMIVSNCGLIALAFTILLLPASPSMVIPFVAIFFLFTMVRGAARGQYYGPLKDANVPMHLSGTAVGLIGCIAYSGDAYIPIIAGKMLDTMDNLTAFKYIILFLICFGIFSIVMCCILLRMIKKEAAAT